MANAIEGATELASARYGTFRILGTDHSPARSIYAAAPLEGSARVGDLVGAYSHAGAVAATNRSARQNRPDGPDLVHQRAGWPQPVSSLDVPVRVSGELFGYLCLTGSVEHHFSAEDEELVAAIAVATGAALTNSSLAARLLLQQRWSTATTEIRAQLARTTDHDPLTTIVHTLAELTDADIVAVSLTNPAADKITVEVAAGPRADLVRNQCFDLADTVSHRALETGRPILLPTWCGTDTNSYPTIEIQPGSLIIIPLYTHNQAYGVLALLRHDGKPPFRTPELALATDIAQQASVALELAHARTAESNATALQRQNQASRKLHDDVIQELFGIGLSLENTAEAMTPDTNTQRIFQRVTEIDTMIQKIRHIIFP